MSEATAIPKLVLPELSAKRVCGDCIFAQKVAGNPKLLDCYGHPPSVHVVGMMPDALNRPQLQIETFVPRVVPTRPACALFQPNLQY